MLQWHKELAAEKKVLRAEMFRTRTNQLRPLGPPVSMCGYCVTFLGWRCLAACLCHRRLLGMRSVHCHASANFLILSELPRRPLIVELTVSAAQKQQRSCCLVSVWRARRSDTSFLKRHRKDIQFVRFAWAGTACDVRTLKPN